MDTKEILTDIASGKVGAITLDTCIFGKPDDTSLETPHLRRLEQFKGSRIRFVLSDVVELEIVSHLEKLAEEAQSVLGRAMRLLERSWRVSSDDISGAVNNLIGEETHKSVVRKRLNAFKERTGCTVISAGEHAKIEELVKRYFSHDAPFSNKADKKHEFPDALALLSLEAWANETGTKVLVVSNDGDWVNFCAETEHLIPVRSLREAFGLFHSDAGVVCDILSKRLHRGDCPEVEDAIRSAIEERIEGMLFLSDAYTGYAYSIEDEFSDISVKKVSIGHNGEVFSPLEMKEEYLVAEIPVSVEVEITCEFTFTTKDWVDKDSFVIGSASRTQTAHLDFQAVVTFCGKLPDEVDVDEVEIEGVNRVYVDYGEIEPDWGIEPE